jgi:hypothetical protein
MLPHIFLTAFIAVSILASAGSVPHAAKATKTQLTGYLVDVSCSHDEAEAGPGWGQKHSRACLLMPACVRSGYAVLTGDNQVIRFDAGGNDRAYKLILATTQDKDWRVRVRGLQAGDQLKVSNIELIK